MDDILNYLNYCAIFLFSQFYRFAQIRICQSLVWVNSGGSSLVRHVAYLRTDLFIHGFQQVDEPGCRCSPNESYLYILVIVAIYISGTGNLS